MRSSISHAQLMQASEQLLETAARAGSPHEQMVASRVRENPSVWVRWENEHAGLMKAVALQRRPPRQVTALKSTCFSLIHRKALFEHLRVQHVHGRTREKLLRFFHQSRGYSQALVEEHENYLRSACSYMCSSHVGSAVIRDGVFEDPMRRYEELYSEYFRLFCEGTIIGGDAGASSKALLPYLKYQINEQRLAVIAMPRRTPSLLRDAALRRPTGDTEKLRVDVLRANFRS
ncbi:MAG TPA: hypothetical protein VK505_07095 [Steroidobacteraceae bacterium]|nr:hypothetical protein [Steroidobacteraceae bacterium]